MGMTTGVYNPSTGGGAEGRDGQVDPKSMLASQPSPDAELQ